MEHPFVEIESWLQSPQATGMFVIALHPGRGWEKCGLKAGVVITSVDGSDVGDDKTFFQAMQPREGEENPTRELKVVQRDGSVAAVNVPASLRGLENCWVREGECAWMIVPDYEGDPDFSALEDGVEYWMRNAFGEEPAGYEMIRFARQDDFLDVEIDFRLGGGEDDQAWDYVTCSRSTHRLDKKLPLVQTAFWEGKTEKKTGEVSLGDDGVWRGVHLEGESEVEVEITDSFHELISGYTSTLLPLTMPFEEGASLTIVHTYDGSGRAYRRERFECIGRRNVEVAGEEMEAWAFAWRHYGSRPAEDDEHFYVTDDRRLVRIDWGPGYGHCWCEERPKDVILNTIPEHIRP